MDFGISHRSCRSFLPGIFILIIILLQNLCLHSMNVAQVASKLRLIYFDIPARGEGIRLALHYSRLPWEDIRLAREEFAQLRSQKKFAFDQLPALEIPDKQVTIFQSAAILRYVGVQCGLYPTNNLELAAVIDSLVDQHNDMLIGLVASRFPARIGFSTITEDQRKVIQKELSNSILPKHLSFFENFLSKSSTGWLASTPTPTIADFALVPRVKLLSIPNFYEGISSKLLDPFPLLQQHLEKFHQLPEIKDYYQKYPFDPTKK